MKPKITLYEADCVTEKETFGQRLMRRMDKWPIEILIFVIASDIIGFVLFMRAITAGGACVPG